MTIQDVTHFHLFGGSGSGAAGFNDADPSIGAMKGRMVLLGGIDVCPLACADFKMLTGVEQACVDLFSLEQYKAWHGHMPPEGWREATADTVRAAAQWQAPSVICLSAPCKGFSGLQSPTRAATPKYVALNELTLRGVWLMLEAFIDDLPGLIVFENVPRIKTAGRHLLDQIIGMLQHYGYATAETIHDCGELGDGLGQSRKRFLLVARLVRKVPPFLYEPPKRPLRSVGEILSHMPLPGDPIGGPMHRIPALQWRTWTRLSLVTAGSDWRSLNDLNVENGFLSDYLIVPDGQTGMPSANGTVADLRFNPSASWKDGQALGVRRWDQSTGTIAAQQGPLQGAYSVADPRHGGPAKHSNEFRIVEWKGAARAVTSAHGTGQAVADPRSSTTFGGKGKYRVTGMGETAGTVIARSDTGQGAFALADPRPNLHRVKGDNFLTGGHYGVVRYTDSAGAVSASACHDNGPWSVADPRTEASPSLAVEALKMPSPTDKLVARILSLDGTWHRPFTTLELAALQSFIDPEEFFADGGPADQGERFVLAGASDQRWREGIGNAIPRRSAKAMGKVMGQTILLARNGETFMLGSTPIWVRPIVAALAVAQQGGAA